MTVLRKTDRGSYVHWCPGCEDWHVFAVDAPNASQARWTFDGNMETPTFNPSMLIRWSNNVCHYFLRAGRIEFLSDSTHKLAGQTIPLPSLPGTPHDR